MCNIACTQLQMLVRSNCHRCKNPNLSATVPSLAHLDGVFGSHLKAHLSCSPALQNCVIQLASLEQYKV